MNSSIFITEQSPGLSSLILLILHRSSLGCRSWGNGWGFRVGATGLRLTGSLIAFAPRPVPAAFGRAFEFTTAIFSSTYAIPLSRRCIPSQLNLRGTEPEILLELPRKISIQSLASLRITLIPVAVDAELALHQLRCVATR